LVLSGVAGTGRLAAVVDGIERALRDGSASEEITYHCPDTATAARLHRALRRRCRDRCPDILVAGEQQLPSPQPADEGPERSETVVVALEVQRFAVQERYRVAEQARPGRLLMTVDTAETSEPWEDLFLTTPRPDAVVSLDRQVRQSRQLWREMRALLPEKKAGHTRTDRRDKGSVTARWAANLDECVACVAAEYEAGRLQSPLALCAPLTEDCTYLGRSLARRGWLPVFRHELDELLLPGLLEFLAAASDAYATSERRRAAAAGTTTDAPAAVISPLSDEPLLPAMLPDSRRDNYLHWLAAVRTRVTDATLTDLYELMAPTAWAAPVLAAPAARDRVARMLTRLGGEGVTALVKRPLWEAWWYEVAALAGRDRAPDSRPVITLATADHRGGSLVSDGVYLCLGTEPDGLHYRVLSRVTDRALVLYQERSPLPSAAGADDLGSESPQ
jgi:hypothetical protein